MPIDPTVLEFLEQVDSGKTPEDVCAGHPELLAEVRERLARLELVRDELDSLFPESGTSPGTRPPGRPASTPEIPGHVVESLLGRGGMGVVYRARHIRLNRPVAVKMLLDGGHAGPPELARFFREAEAVAALRHPNVVQIYDVGESEGRPYFTMELVAGGSLAELPRPAPPRQAASLLLPLSLGIHAAHDAGIIHRDLKPANVLIDEDGTPKIGDFGLSRRIDDAAGLTLNGAVVGTPSYMAPEQAAGERAAVGAAVDVYALGSILYELLTGRPPFRGQTTSETIWQVLNTDPTAPSRLNARIPRDLEIICLKCLSKDPVRRYPSAAALAGDLRRFLDGEAIVARPEGRLERLAKRIRRRPGLSASIGIALALVVVALGLASERAMTHRRIEAAWAATELAAADDLRDMVESLEKKSWGLASAAYERAKGRLGDQGTPALRRALARGRSDLDIVAGLDLVRTETAQSVEDTVDYPAADRAYAGAFLASGLCRIDENPEVAADRIRESHIRGAVVDALDIWPVAPDDSGRKEWLLRVAALADRDQSSWATRARDPEIRRSREALDRLCDTVPVEDRSVPLLLAMALDLGKLGGDPIPLLTRVQQAHPGDFWANNCLAEHLIEADRNVEAVRYAQAALSLRPDLSIGYTALARALLHSDKTAEAIGTFRTALQFTPTSPVLKFNVGHALTIAGRSAEAIAFFRDALRLAPRSAVLHCGLGDSLAAIGRNDEALAEYRQAVALDPAESEARMAERQMLHRLHRSEEARAAWREHIEAAPRDQAMWDGYAEFCLFLGHEEDYLRARGELIDRFGATADPRGAERIGRACLLLPATPELTGRAAGLIDRAIAEISAKPRTWVYPYFLFARGLAEYRQGRPDAALAVLQGDAARVLMPCPQLVMAMAQQRLGRHEEARRTLAAAIASVDWDVSRADTREAWMVHILRREAESVVGQGEPARKE